MSTITLSPQPSQQQSTETVPQTASWQRDLLWIFLLSLPLFFWGLGAWGFFDPDEGRYGEIPREMLVRHDFITPTLNFLKYFEKPPLLYWSVAAFYKIFGFHEWAARLVSALSALLGLFTAYALGRRMFGRRAGLLSAIILATSVFWAFMARFIIIDTLLSAMIFLSLALWWLGHTQGAAGNEQSAVSGDNARARWCFLGFWVALALGVLSKGPVVVVLIGGTIFLYTAICRQWRAWRKMQWILGVPLFLLVVTPWFVLVAQRNPEFNHFFWYDQHIGRFLGTGKVEHQQKVYWFLEFLPLLFFPWSFFVPAALLEGWHKLKRAPKDAPNGTEIYTPRQRAVIFLLCGAIFITAFFSASSSKLLTYVLPVLPLLAVLLAAYFNFLFERKAQNVERVWPRALSGGALVLALFLVLIVVVGATVGASKLHSIEALPAFYVVPLCIACALWTASLIWVTLQRQLGWLMVAISGGFSAFLLGALLIVNAAAPNHLPQSLIAYIEPGLRAGGKIATWNSYTQSVGFYAEQRLRTFVDSEDTDAGELVEIPLSQQNMSAEEQNFWLPVGIEGLKEFMAQNKPAYCLMKDHRSALQVLAQLNDGSQEIIWNKRRSLIGNRAAVAITPPKPGGLLGVETESTRETQSRLHSGALTAELPPQGKS